MTNILSYYDGPEIVVLQNPDLGLFVGTVDYDEGEIPEIFAVITHPDQIHNFTLGNIDLRTLILRSSKYVWYESQTNDLSVPIDFTPHFEEAVPTRFVPSEDIYLDTPDHESIDVREQAYGLDNFVAALHINHRDLLRKNRLDLNVYEQIVSRFRKMMNVASRIASEGRVKMGSIRTALDISASPQPGSVILLLEARDKQAGASLFEPFIDLHNALNYISDGHMEIVNSPRTSLDNFPQDFLRNIIDFYGIICRNNIDLAISWSDPKSISTGENVINSKSAKEFMEFLESNLDTNLREIRETIVGSFVRVNRDSRTWGLDTSSGLTKGKLKENVTENVLDGLIVGETYEFKCVRQITAGQAHQGAAGELYLEGTPKRMNS